MPILKEEVAAYFAFAAQVARGFGAVPVPPETVLWHYTNGAALIGMLESMSVFSTQVSCLNDTSELRYGSRLYRETVSSLLPGYSGNEPATGLLEEALEYFKENEDFPYQASVPHFVTAFSAERDDLSQWRAYGGGENGYAVAFRAGDLFPCPNAVLVKVVYDEEMQRSGAKQAVDGMVKYFLEGLARRTPTDPILFGQEFFQAWDDAITMVAPMIKDPGFAKEREYRLIKPFEANDLGKLKFFPEEQPYVATPSVEAELARNRNSVSAPHRGDYGRALSKSEDQPR